MVNLTTGAATIAGTALTISSPGNFENVIGGEGNDTLVGNANSNKLLGGRGGDSLSAGDDWDLLWGGFGDDTLTGGANTDAFVIEKDAGSDDVITDFQAGTDRIILSGFDGTTGNNVSLTQESSNVRIDLGDGQSVLIQNATTGDLTANRFVSVEEGLAARDLEGFDGWGFGSDAAEGQTAWAEGDVIYWAGDGGEEVFGGNGHDRILGGPGNDTLVGENDSSTPTGGNDTISGENGNDLVFGGGGDDILYGGADLDYIAGGAGNDVVHLQGDQGLNNLSGSDVFSASVSITGGSYTGAVASGGNDDDRFVLVEDTSPEASQGLMKNLIVDFDAENANEKIDLSQIRAVQSFSDLTFSELGVDGVGYLRVFLGPMQSGTQYFTLQDVRESELTAENFIFWNGLLPQPQAENVEIAGTSGADVLDGDAGGNKLDGGAGADTLSGRTGDDTYIVDDPGDVVIELQGGGYDYVRSSVSYVMPGDVESLKLMASGAAINGTGNAAANRITGNGANNVLDGGPGTDVLIGRGGDDTYVVGDGSDQTIEDESAGTDLVQSSVSYVLGPNVENLTLTGSDPVNGTGNALNNVLIGNANHNRLDGAQGADTMQGGNGDDVYFVDAAADMVSESANGGIDLVFAGLAYTLPGDVENLAATGNVGLNLTGNALDNVITGGAAADSLSGGAGDDWLDGGLGNDTLVGGTGNDIYVLDSGSDLIVENADEGSDTAVVGFTYGVVAKPNLENITLTGTGDFNANGNASNNVLTGNDGANSITGADGDDWVDGGNGTDTLDGGNGADTLDGGNGNDSLYGGFQADSLLGGNGDDSLSGGNGFDTLAGGDGYDLLDGGNGNDWLDGGAEDDTLGGGNTNDTLLGGTGNDSLDGGSGVDSLIGGTGDDLYYVDDAADGVVEATNEGIDTVLVGFSYDITGNANVENVTLTGTASINATGNTTNNVLVGNDGTNSIIGSAGDDSLQGGDGTGDGADTLIGGTGDDIYVLDDIGLNDTIVENANEGTDTVLVGYGFGVVQKPNLENITLLGTSAINATGNASNNVLVGNDGANSITGSDGHDQLYGADGSDTLDGGTGNDYLEAAGGGTDSLVGGTGNDIYSIDASDTIVENANEGIDTVLVGFTYGVVSKPNLENITLTGTGAIDANGNAANNLLIGNDGANSITGADGDDTLDGGLGSDTLIGGLGNDVYVLDSSSDLIVENADEGSDTAVVGFTYGVVAKPNLENITLTGTGDFNATGNASNNVLIGNDGANSITGGDGDDTLTGSADNDHVFGEDGDDSVVGGTGNDSVLGQAGNDTVYGGEGNDTLDGGAHDDSVAGGNGDDSLA